MSKKKKIIIGLFIASVLIGGVLSELAPPEEEKPDTGAQNPIQAQDSTEPEDAQEDKVTSEPEQPTYSEKKRETAMRSCLTDYLHSILPQDTEILSSRWRVDIGNDYFFVTGRGMQSIPDDLQRIEWLYKCRGDLIGIDCSNVSCEVQ